VDLADEELQGETLLNEEQCAALAEDLGT